MKATTRRGGGGGMVVAVNTTNKKKKEEGASGFLWGCGGSKSVAVVAGNLSTMALPKSSSSSSSTISTAKSAPVAKPPAPASDDDAEGAPPSVDALLGQLRELERGVRALGVRCREEDGARPCRCGARARPRHRRGVLGGRLEEESVAVVTETADPLGEFRRSMAEMVAENGITGGAELRELLQRFLSLNSARHHHLILRAFADVWEELFAGAGDPSPPYKQKRPVVSPEGHSTLAS